MTWHEDRCRESSSRGPALFFADRIAFAFACERKSKRQPAAADNTPIGPRTQPLRRNCCAQQPLRKSQAKAMPQVHAHETRGAAAWTAATKSTSSEDHIKRAWPPHPPDARYSYP